MDSLLDHRSKQRPGGGGRGKVESCGCPFRVSAFFVHVTCFVGLSFVGFLILELLGGKPEFRIRNIDLCFTAVSAATVSSMSAVEMEAFSDQQLIVLAALMFFGGEIFVSMISLILRHLKNEPEEADVEEYYDELDSDSDDWAFHDPFLEDDARNYLISCIWRYILVLHFLGVAFVFFYLILNPSAAAVLNSQGLKISTFTVFTVISTFSNCGFVPTNENMIAFRENSGLLLILIPLILLGNTLFPFCLRILIGFQFHRSKTNRGEADYLLRNTNKIDYFHLVPSLHSLFLAATVSGFVLIGFLLFSALEWNSPELNGLNLYQKTVCILFQTVNARFSGETVVDLSKITPALLVFFIIMMYLPPYTSFLPIGRDEPGDDESKKGTPGMTESLAFSQLSYLAIFVMAICITERESMENDPVNFSVLNITFEVISAYGNVGFTTGYSCKRRLIQDECVNRLYGFVGKWSDEGKIVLIIVMFFGRLKQFSMHGGRAWKLL